MSASDSNGSRQYRVDDLVIHVGQRQVSRDGEQLDIGGLTFDLLLAIVETSPNIISSDELVEKVWSGRPTSPETITQRAMMLRQALGDDADHPKYVEVVRGQGFRLIPAIGAKRSAGNKSNQRIALAVVAVAVFIAAFAFLMQDEESDEFVLDVLPNSVAVLPFENVSPNPDDAYYATGIHEEILNQLVKIQSLSVIARTSVLQYAETQQSIPEIADELNVGAVMEGTVRYSDDQIRITVQLVDGATGVHRWSETYTRPFDDIFAVETDVALNVATELRAQFSDAEKAFIERRPTASAEAYRLYLAALSFSSRLNTNAAQNMLDRAIAEDPEFALAYAEKASNYIGGLNARPQTRDEAIRRENLALAAIDNALQLQPDLIEAHVRLAYIHSFNWRGAEAKRSFEYAYGLNPNNSSVLAAYAQFSAFAGDYELARELEQKRSSIDPRWGIGNSANNYELMGDLEAAATKYRNVESPSAASIVAHAHLGLLELARKNIAAAERSLAVARSYNESELPPNSTVGRSGPMISMVAYGYQRLGDDETFKSMSDMFDDLADEKRFSAPSRVLMSLARNDEEAAKHWLEVVAEQEPYSGFQMVHRLKANVFQDPRLDKPEFVELRNRIGFTDLE